MSELRRKFTIDDQLGKKAKALGYLNDMQDFEGLQVYMTKNELYKEALDLCKYKPKEEKAVLHLYAVFLNSRNRFKEAGIGEYKLFYPCSNLTCEKHSKPCRISQQLRKHIEPPSCGEKVFPAHQAFP